MSMLSPGARKLALTLHVLASVGWLGAVAVFLALAIVAVTHSDVVMVRAAYVTMERSTWLVIVPLEAGSRVRAPITAAGVVLLGFLLLILLIHLSGGHRAGH